MTFKRDLGEASYGALWTTLGAIFFIALLSGFSIWALFFQRHTLPYAEETRRQVYDQSRAYQQGTQLALTRYCAEFRLADPEHKVALAQAIRETVASYNGPLSAANQQCLEEIH